MRRLQKFLLVLIVLEILAAVVLFQQRAAKMQLPEVDWSQMEPATVLDIQKIEKQMASATDRNWLELGNVYRTVGLFPAAEYCYRKASEISPENVQIQYSWAVCLDLLGETREASARYERILRQTDNPQLTNYCWLNIAQDRLREENTAAALIALRQAGALPKAKLLIARILTRSGKAAEATQILDDLIRAFPDQIDASEMKSWAESALGHQESALQFQERSLRCDKRPVLYDLTYPSVRARREKLGSLGLFLKSFDLESAGKIGEARARCEEALQSLWTEDYARQLASLELTLGHAPKSLEILNDCLARVGGTAKTYELIGDVWRSTGDESKAREFWLKAADFIPNAKIYRKLAESAERTKSAALVPQYRGLEQYEFGKTAWSKNDLQSARRYFVNATRLAGDDFHGWFYLAETERFLGDKAASERAYRRCLQLNPGHGRALRGLERLK